MQNRNIDLLTQRCITKNRFLYFMFIAIYLCTFLTSCTNMWNRDKAESLEISTDLSYVFTKPKLNVEPDHEFIIDIEYDPKEVEGYEILDPYSHAIEVYCDSGFTIKAKGVNISKIPWENKFHIKPHEVSVSAIDSDGNNIRFTNKGEWGFHDEYYIVQKLDAKTGDKLEKPLVTRFTVKQKVEKPELSFSVDNKGFGRFSWKPVDGAVKYYIVSMDLGSEFEQVLGTTNKTEWTTDDSEQTFEIEGKVYSQNGSFKNYRFSEDDKHGKDYIELSDLQKFTTKVYGVIAQTENGMSAYSFIKGDEIIKLLPNSVANNAAKEIKALWTEIKTFDDIPAQMPITMGDGSTVLRHIIIDVNNVKIEEQVIVNLGDNNKSIDNATKKFDICVVPYIIDGTILNGKFKISTFDKKTYHDEVQRISDRNNEAQVKTGLEKTAFEYSTQEFDPGKLPISRTKPDVAYKVSATNSFTEYLAANMIEGNEYIEISKYINNGLGISLNDALYEALEQNPYILGVNKFDYFAHMKVLNVTYKITSKDERIKEQNAISEEVDRVISKIILKEMSDEEKVEAINNYIIKNGDYDYNAYNALKKGQEDNFKHAWTPAGILLDKKAVCGGYSVTFKVLADKAGLESVYVSGITNGERHAWNKVKVNGVWRVIDTTWNDTVDQPNQYYLLTDKQASETRTQDDSFVIDLLINNYAAD